MKKMLMVFIFILVFAAFSQAKLMDKILVKVNDALILESEIEEAVDLIAAQMKMAGKPANKKKIRKEILANLVEQKLIISMAKDEQIAVSDEAVADKVNEFIGNLRKRFTDEAQFEEALLQEGMSYSDFRMKLDSQVRDNIIFTKVKQKKQQEFISKAIVSEVEIKRYFNRNKSDFKIGDNVSLHLITFPSGSMDDAQAVYKKAAAGADFDSIGAELEGKDGISAVKIEDVDTTELDKKIRSAIRNKRKGDVIKPLEKDDAIQVIKILSYKRGTTQALNKVKDKVRVKIIEEKVEKMWNEWIKKAKDRAFIKYM